MMRKAMLPMVLAILFLAPSPGLDATDARTLTGEYLWKNRDSLGSLEAVFSPAGQGVWEVAFYFSFQGGKHVYTGTAEGGLSEGELEGEVLSDRRRRTFTFQGHFEDGIFYGTHAETTPGRERSTGTMILKE